MGTPATRSPVRVARGTYSNLNTNKGDIQEGEICYATDQNKIYIKEGSNLEQNSVDLSTVAPLTGATFTGDIIIDNAKELRFHEADGNGSNYVGFEAPATLGGNKIWVLPSADGSADEFLKTNGAGTLSWGTSSSGATGGATDKIFVENERTITTNYTITSTKNAHSVGPISINNNIVVTIPANSTWLVS